MKLKALVLLTLLAVFASARNYSVNASESSLADQIQFSLNHVTNDDGILMPKLGPIFGLDITYDSIVQGKNNHDIFQLKRLAEIDGYTSSAMDSLVSSALDSQTMSLHWPDFQVGYGYAMSVYDKFIVNCYRWAQQHGQASKWDKNAAYQEFLMSWHNLSNFLWFNPGDGVRDFGDRYYDENAQVLTIFLKFYQSGVSDAKGPALQMWDHLLTNHWSGSYFPYRGTSGQVECEAGNFAESIGELYVATGRNLSNFPDYLLKDLDYKFLNNGDWSGKLWRNYAVQHAESNPELRLENTLAAWAALHSYYIMMDSTMRANFVKLLTEFPTAWKGLVDYSSLYSNGQFGWRSGASPSGSATLAGMLVLLLGGIVPDTGSLALPVMDESYQDIGSEFPISHLRFDYESRTIRIPVWAGNIKFIFGSGVASHNFTTDGIYEIHFSADWNTVDSSSLVSPLMSDQFSYLRSPVTPPGINILSPQNTTYAITPVPLTFTVNGSVSWMGYSLDEQVNVTISSNTTLAGLSVGQHSVIVYANDTSGNMGASEAVDFAIVQHNIIVPDDYPTIQEVINHANDGAAVFVRKGTYLENLVINKSLSLVGENWENTIVDGNSLGNVTEITKSNVTISGFTIQNSGDSQESNGIIVTAQIGNCNIRGNRLLNNHHGMTLWNSSGNRVFGNNVGPNYDEGIWVYSGSDNELVGNTITNSSSAVVLFSSSNNTIRENEMTQNFDGVSILSSSEDNDIFKNNVTDNKDVAIQLYSSSNCNDITQNNIRNNTVDGIVIDHSSGNRIVSNNVSNGGGHGIYVHQSVGNLIVGNSILDNGAYGVHLDESQDNVVGTNRIANNARGVSTLDSSNNSIVANDLSENDLGISSHYSQNFFYHNTFLNNAKQVDLLSSFDVWDNGYPYGGNHWGDYNGTDSYSGPYQNETASDGIGDTPYVIDAVNRDNYPLMGSFGTLPDIAVVNVTVPKNVVGQGLSLIIGVTVANLGNEAGSFNMSVYANTTAIQTQYITLGGG